MRINFFEEFYTIPTLISRCKGISFPSTIYVACKSLTEFLFLKKIIENQFIHLELGYWPILPKSYWVSPFSYTTELETLFNELLKYQRKDRIKVLIDLELPILHPELFIINISCFKKNKVLIKQILDLHKTRSFDFFSAEYPTPFTFIKRIGLFLGICYPHEKYHHTTITMLYNTPIGSIQKKLFMSRIITETTNNHQQIALGLIAPGILNEKNLLTPEILKNNVNRLRTAKISDVTVYSLAGFSPKYQAELNI